MTEQEWISAPDRFDAASRIVVTDSRCAVVRGSGDDASVEKSIAASEVESVRVVPTDVGAILIVESRRSLHEFLPDDPHRWPFYIQIALSPQDAREVQERVEARLMSRPDR